jgi:hypothetical protein
VGLIGICNLQLSCPSLGFMQGFKFAKKKNLHFFMSPSLHQCIAEMKRTFHSVTATSCTSCARRQLCSPPCELLSLQLVSSASLGVWSTQRSAVKCSLLSSDSDSVP